MQFWWETNLFLHDMALRSPFSLRNRPFNLNLPVEILLSNYLVFERVAHTSLQIFEANRAGSPFPDALSVLKALTSL
jgi:hypothetical protein